MYSTTQLVGQIQVSSTSRRVYITQYLSYDASYEYWRGHGEQQKKMIFSSW